ncbi:hypothetical protein [Variovorax paradoxus]|uniref:hypothetical protein n=1 Tax=Variovorax paradoxus TaxID=34073 RepID=UPI0030D34CBF
MQYMLMFYQPASEFEQREDAASQRARDRSEHQRGGAGLPARHVGPPLSAGRARATSR